MPAWNFVRKSVYRDSVVLMRLARDMEAVPEVRRAAAMMGTPENRALLRDAGLLAAEGEAAGATDLIIAVRADTLAAAEAARAACEAEAARVTTSQNTDSDTPTDAANVTRYRCRVSMYPAVSTRSHNGWVKVCTRSATLNVRPKPCVTFITVLSVMAASSLSQAVRTSTAR